jgi:F-box protein 9
MDDNAELESFRRQWREEVARRSKPTASGPVLDGAFPSAAPITSPALLTGTRPPPTRHAATDRKDLDEEGPAPASFDPEELAQQVGELSVTQEDDSEEDGFTRRAQQEPNSALEHFERAVEKEAAGNLGDSLQHYRKAYRVSWITVDN